MTGLASLLGRSNLASRAPAAGNVVISNVPGLPMTLYMAGARMVHYYPVSIPYHGTGLNITVQSYAGRWSSASPPVGVWCHRKRRTSWSATCSWR